MEVTSQLAQNLEAMAPFYTGQDSEAEAEQDFRPVPADYVITQVENTAIWRIFQKKKKIEKSSYCSRYFTKTHSNDKKITVIILSYCEVILLQ